MLLLMLLRMGIVAGGSNGDCNSYVSSPEEMVHVSLLLTTMNQTCLEDRKDSWPCRATPDNERVALDCGTVASSKSLPKRNGRLKSGGKHPVRKVVWPAQNETSDWC